MARASYLLDGFILLLFLLILHILFLGGFHFRLAGLEVSATSPGKPGLILVAAFFLKIAIADWRRDIEKKKILLYSTFLLIFLAGELASRAAFLRESKNDLAWASKYMRIHNKRGDPDNLRMLDFVAVSGNTRIIYEPLPGASGKFMGAHVRINAQGFRDDQDIEEEKGPDEFRIVGLGDSNLFGWGVEFRDTHGEVAEAALNRLARPGARFRFINLGLPGYNTAMEVETFLQKGLPLSPDMAVIHLVGNDMELPNFLMKKEDPWTSGKSFFFYYLVKLLSLPANRTLNLYELDRVKEDVPGPVNLVAVPKEYRSMVGEEAFRREIRRLKAKCDELGIPLLAIIAGYKVEGGGEGFFEKVMKGEGIPYVIGYSNMKAFLDAHGLDFEDLYLSPGDRHPTRHGHLLIGQNLVSAILEPQFLGRPSARKLARFLSPAVSP